MEEFQRSSKELEEELERDVDRAEKEKEALRVKFAKMELERDEWKVCICVLGSMGVDEPDILPVQVHDTSDYTQHNNHIPAART